MNKNKQYYSFSRPEMLKYIPKNTKYLLDIGCGEGCFGELVKKNIDNCKVVGVELNKNAATIAKEKIDEVYCGRIEDKIGTIQFSGNNFGCITFNDSLEHFAYPIDILIACRTILNNDGVVVASIPNLRYFPVLKDLVFNKNFEYKDSGILDYTHLRFFTKNSINALFDKAGYKIKYIEGININHSLLQEIEEFGYNLKTDLSDTPYLQFAVVAEVNR